MDAYVNICLLYFILQIYWFFQIVLKFRLVGVHFICISNYPWENFQRCSNITHPVFHTYAVATIIFKTSDISCIYNSSFRFYVIAWISHLLYINWYTKMSLLGHHVCKSCRHRHFEYHRKQTCY